MCVAAGRDHSLAVSDLGYTYACGDNKHSQLGLPGLEYSLHFAKVHSCENVVVEKVFAGGDHSFIMLDHHNTIRDREKENIV